MFALLIASLGIGVGAGLLARGRLVHLREVRLAWVPLLFASLVVGMVPLFADLSRRPRQMLQIVSLLGVLVFLVTNIARARGAMRFGFVTVLVGWALNFVVIAANGGMPLSLWAWGHSGQQGAPTPGRGGFFKIVVADPETSFRALGDVIPIRALSQVVSFGDIVLIAGIAVIIAGAMRSEPARRAETASA